MGASYGNAGGIAVSSVIPVSTPGLLRSAPGWLLDPKGPLTVRWRYLPTLAPWLVKFLRAGSTRRVAEISTALAALLRHTYADLDTLLEAAGIAHMLDRGGALYLYDRESELERERWVWNRRTELGMVVERVDGRALPDLEPDIAADFACAMFARDWSRLSDPYRFVTALAAHFARHGGVILRTEVTELRRDGEFVTTIQLADGTSRPIDRLVVAAGAWSARLAVQLGERVPLESQRGYHTTLPDPGIGVNHQIVYANQGFVITPLDPGLRVAGTVELAGLDAPADYRRARILLPKARRVFPAINTDGGSEWMGHRPALPDSLPVIGRSPGAPNVYYAFGHGHLGLTMAPTTGRLIAELISHGRPGLNLSAYRFDRF